MSKKHILFIITGLLMLVLTVLIVKTYWREKSPNETKVSEKVKVVAEQRPDTTMMTPEWKSKVSEVDIVKVVNFLINNKGKEIELNGKHIITGKEKLDIKIKMLECCTEQEFEDIIELISKKGEVKSSNFNKREIHASVPADEIMEIDDIWNVAGIEFEPDARKNWIQAIK